MRSSEVSDIAKEKSCQKSFNTFVYSSLPALIISSFSSSPAVKSYSIYFLKKFSKKIVTMRPLSSGDKRFFSFLT